MALAGHFLRQISRSEIAEESDQSVLEDFQIKFPFFRAPEFEVQNFTHVVRAKGI